MRYAIEHKLANDALQKSKEELQEAYEELKAAQSSLHQRDKMAPIGQLAAGVQPARIYHEQSGIAPKVRRKTMDARSEFRKSSGT